MLLGDLLIARDLSVLHISARLSLEPHAFRQFARALHDRAWYLVPCEVDRPRGSKPFARQAGLKEYLA